MAEVCAFCGAELKRFGKESVVCGGVSQPVCKDCWTKYRDSSQIECCREILKHSWAQRPEQVRAWLTEREQEEAEKQAEAEKLGQLMNCCGQPMTPLGESEFQLGRMGFFMGNLSNLMSGAMELAVFRCERCGQIKFMDPKIMKDRMNEL